MQLARRIFAKHPWTIATFNNLVAMYEAKGIEGVIDNGIAAPLLELCPPPAERRHEASGPSKPTRCMGLLASFVPRLPSTGLASDLSLLSQPLHTLLSTFSMCLISTSGPWWI